VPDGVVDDVTDVGVGQLVGDLRAASRRGDQSGLAEDLEVLGQQWLAHGPPGGLERRLQLVDAARSLAELDDGGQAGRRRQGLEQIHCSGQPVRNLRVEHCSYISSSLYKEHAIDLRCAVTPPVFEIIPDTGYRYLKPIQTSARSAGVE